MTGRGSNLDLNMISAARPTSFISLEIKCNKKWFILFSLTLWIHDVFLQVVVIFSNLRPRPCTYLSDPDFCRLAHGKAPFGPIECQQLLWMRLWCISSHKTGAYTLHFFKIRGKTEQPRLSRLELSNKNVLYFPTRGILLYFSSDQKFESSLHCRLCVLVFFAPQRQLEAMSRRTFHCFHSDSAPSVAIAETDGEDDGPAKFSSDSKSVDARPSLTRKVQGRLAALQLTGHNLNCTHKWMVHNR